MTRAVLSTGLLFCLAAPLSAADSALVKVQWASPPREFSSAPLWVWNDLLTEDMVLQTLRDLAGQRVRQAFVHPRPGLMTPYLSADWFRLWKAALAEAERLDMNLWIYDENSYPSGFAGGWVPQLMPESVGRTLALRAQKAAPAPEPDLFAAFRLSGQQYEDVTAAVRAGKSLPQGDYLVARLVRSRPSPWHGGRGYVDLMYPGVTKKFLEVTLDAYRRHLGSEFGGRIPGSFTDEPRLEGRGGVAWTDDLPAVFQKRWGYDLLPQLPCLARPLGDWKRVRHNFLTVLQELFIERWAKPYYKYCALHGLEFTGHYWEHEWPRCESVPDSMAMYAWMQRPGIDCLMNQYREDVHAQFGNVRMVRELASVANQLELPRTLCEAYGAGGWDLRFEDMKRIGDWLYVLGVNMLDEHLSYISLRGARKRDHPQSFSYHEPWWTDYHVMARYFSRLSLAMSQGRQINEVLVLEPTSTAWMYQFPAEPQHKERLQAVGDRFQELLVALERAQVEYDLGCEDIIANHGSVEGKKLRVGKRDYGVVVLPPLVENVNAKTADLLENYVEAGGQVLCCGPAPALIDGRPSPRIPETARRPGWTQLDSAQLPRRLVALSDDSFLIRTNEGDRGLLFHHRRRLDDGELLLLVNTSIDQPSEGMIVTALRSAEQWDPESGAIRPFPAVPIEGPPPRTAIGFSLAPCASLLLYLSPREPDLAAHMPAGKPSPVAPAGPVEVCRLDDNVLTLDYVDVRAGGRSLEKAYFYAANQFVWQQHGIDRNPWDHAVQFGDELVSKKFPPDSGFEVAYRFTLASAVPSRLAIVVERPDLYTIAANGQPVAADGWWLDRAFGRIDLAGVARVGANEVTLKARPFTMLHELESAYLLGDFTLRPTDSGFVVVPGGQLRVDAKGWSSQGHPFYAAGVSYARKYALPAPAGRYEVVLGDWYGAVARVLVNGQLAGRVFRRPWRVDVTRALRPGENTIEVVVVGTLKNTLGPHHGEVQLGTAWPAMFQKGPKAGPPPGGAYSTVEYGLFEPFQLQHSQ